MATAPKRNGRSTTRRGAGRRHALLKNGSKADDSRNRPKAVLQDVSDELEKQLRSFDAVVSSVSDFIYSFDLSGRFTFVNQPLLDLWQKTLAEAVGKNFHDLDYPPALARKLQRQIQRVIKTVRPLTDETPYTSAVGERQYEYIFVPILSLGGEVEAVAGVTRDITERKKREAELLLLKRQNERALERRVKERTIKLLATNKELQNEISLRKRLESELLEVSDREQRRLGQDLHDSLCQHLAATAFMTRALAERMRSKKTIEPAEIEEIAGLINEGVIEARLVARGLHPVEMDSAGLPAALRSLLQITPNVSYRTEIDDDLPAINHSVATHLYRIAREAVINANKHARAREIIVRMRSTKKWIELNVTDNGIGIPRVRRSSAGLGMHIMNYRARAIGARLMVERLKPRGTRITCCFPRK